MKEKQKTTSSQVIFHSEQKTILRIQEKVNHLSGPHRTKSHVEYLDVLSGKYRFF